MRHLTRDELETHLVKKIRALPFDVLRETLDFMEFISARRVYPSSEAETEIWKEDFLSISQWDINEDEIRMGSWKIELF